MVEDPRKPGYYAGWLTAAMQLGRLFTSVYWGKFSDRHGRKPVIKIGLVTTGVLALAFGLCTNFWVAVAIRFAQGMFDSVLTCSKTLVTEIFPEAHQAKAISLQGATWGVSKQAMSFPNSCTCSTGSERPCAERMHLSEQVCVIIGPSIGGLLARPAIAFPETFAADGFLGRFPYFLPMCVPAALCAAALVAIRIVHEPVRAKKQQEGGVGDDRMDGEDETETARLIDNGEGEGSSTGAKGNAAGGAGEGQQAQQFSVWTFCVQPVPRLMLAYYVMHMVSEFTDGTVFPLWASAPTSAGGLGFTSRDIGTVLAATGAAVIVGQVFAYPVLHKRFGTIAILRWWPLLQIPCYVAMAAAPQVHSAFGGSSWAYWAVALVTRFRAVLAEMCFSAMSLGLNYAVPASRRGAYNGFGSAVSSIGRMAGPSLGAPMYAFSITNGLPALPLGRCLVMEYIVAMLAVLSWLSWSMPPSLQRPCVEDNPR